jgi:transcriptional regulator with XRE-family HTH domain
MTPREEFGKRLRAVRERAGMQAKQVAEIIGIDAGLVSRYELGQRWARPDHVLAWGAAVGMSDPEIDELMEALTDAHGLDQSLRSTAKYGPKAAQARRSKMFQSAIRVRAFAVTEIPFFLQTAEYAQQTLGEQPDASAIADMRQLDGNAVGTPGRYFEVVLAESALRFLPCEPDAMRGQISRLHGLVDSPGIGFGIIPFGVRLNTLPKNAFSVYDETTVIDTFAGEVTLTPKDAPRYAELMDQLWLEAVRGDSARELLIAAAKALPAS